MIQGCQAGLAVQAVGEKAHDMSFAVKVNGSD
jgi:hypothetical protein